MSIAAKPPEYVTVLIKQARFRARVRAYLQSPTHRLVLTPKSDEISNLGLKQPRRSAACSVSEAAELGPNHIRCDTAPSCRRIETAIGRAQHSGWITNHRCHPFNPIGYDLGMLHDIRQGIDY